MDKQMRKRLAMTLGGVILSALSVGLFKASVFGTDPFQCFANGLANRIPIPFGTLYVIINLVLLLVIFLWDRKKIGIATFINLFFTGYIVQFSTDMLAMFFPDPTLLMRCLFLAIGVLLMCFASALYFTSNLGVSTYDAVALILDERTRLPFRFIRIGTDLICVGIGFALGAVVGIGTLITAFFMGPVIHFFMRTIAQPMLYGRPQQGVRV